MIYPQVIKYLNSFINYERLSGYCYNASFELGRFRKFLEYIGNPQKELNVIHIAGSKGKGSTCAFISYILKEAGFKVGLYTSPHLNDFRERIRVLAHSPKLIVHNTRAKSLVFEGMIPKNDICSLVSRLKPAIDKFNRKYRYNNLTLFEVYTAIAFQYFKNNKVDFAVLETGLGGRLDATNVCSSLVSVITPISLEHTYLLGSSVGRIAFEKASIIKKENKTAINGRKIAVSSAQDKSAMKVIERAACENKSILLKEGKDFGFRIKKDNAFDYRGEGNLEHLGINLLGRHQAANAALAIASVEALQYHNIKVKQEAVRRGLSKCVWPARFEIISRNPTVIIDGAQNSASMQALHQAVKENFPGRKIWLVFGIASDKELRDTCRQAEKITRNIILTRSDNPRAAEPCDLLKYFKADSLIAVKDSREALKVAKIRAKKEDIILVTGSLYLCGEIREQINRR